MFYKVFILFCTAVSSFYGMEPEYFKNVVQAHLPKFEPFVAKDNNLYFAGMYEDKHAEQKDIQHSGYDYKLYKSFISHKYFAAVEPNFAIDTKAAINQNPFIAALIANNYEIYLTPREDLNNTFFLLLISLMKDNKLVFTDLQWGNIYVNDIIFNVKMSFDADLGMPSKRPRFTIMINNFFGQGSNKAFQSFKTKYQEDILNNHNYQRTKIYTEQLLIFLIKKFREQIARRITDSQAKPSFAYSINDWMWVKQATSIFDEDREKYVEGKKSFAFLRPDITGKTENYAINRAPIVNQALTILDQEKNSLVIKKLNWYQNFVMWRSLVTELVPECMPYQKNDIMFFNKPKLLKTIKFQEIFCYFEEANKPFNGLFAHVGNKNWQFNEKNISSEKKEYVYSVFTNCYQIYLMPEQAHKEAILRILTECVQKNEFVYRENDQNIHFNNIVFNMGVNLDTIKDTISPTFILYVSNIAPHNGQIKNMSDMAQKQNVYRTKKHTEQLILFLHAKFKQAECLAFSGQIPEASVQIKDLLFVSQGFHSHFQERKDTIFNATKNFAYFLPGVTGKEEDYIINPEKLFGKEEPKPSLSGHVQESLRQSDIGQRFGRSYNNSQPVDISLWGAIRKWLCDTFIAPLIWINNFLKWPWL